MGSGGGGGGGGGSRSRTVLKSNYMIGIVTRTRVDLKPDWTSFWWMDVFTKRLEFISNFKDNIPFLKRNHFLWWYTVHRCVDR